MRKREDLMEEGTIDEKQKKLFQYTSLLAIGVVGVTICSYFIVDSATYIGLSLGVPRIIIGATIVALGTSIPELVISLQATKNYSINLALENIVGNGFLNVTLILVITLVAANLTINIGAFTNVAVFSLISNLFHRYF
jgi:cation:H+ antiporter